MSSVEVKTLADARQVCLHLSDLEWKAILGLSDLLGEKQVLLLLSNNSPAEHQCTGVQYTRTLYAREEDLLTISYQSVD